MSGSAQTRCVTTDTPNQGDNIGITPIYTAIKTGHMDIVQYLAGLTDKYNPSALDIHFAVKSLIRG